MFSCRAMITINSRHELDPYSGITGISGSSHLPSTGYSTSYWVWNAEDVNDSLSMQWMRVDGSFIPNFELKMMAGRNFSAESFG